MADCIVKVEEGGEKSPEISGINNRIPGQQVSNRSCVLIFVIELNVHLETRRSSLKRLQLYTKVVELCCILPGGIRGTELPWGRSECLSFSGDVHKLQALVRLRPSGSHYRVLFRILERTLQSSKDKPGHVVSRRSR